MWINLFPLLRDLRGWQILVTHGSPPPPSLWSSCSSIYANTLKSHTHTGIDNARGKMRWDWFGSGVVANKWFINLGLWSILGVLFMPYESVVVGWGKGKDCLYVWCALATVSVLWEIGFLAGFPFWEVDNSKTTPSASHPVWDGWMPSP